MAFSLQSHLVFNAFISRRIVFFLTFNQIPDFFTTDDAGRRANSFQIYFDSDAKMAGPLLDERLAERIVRGDEMTLRANFPIGLQGDLPIRNASGHDPDPESGGWGPIVGSVRTVLIGATMSFVVPWALLQEDNGRFSYAIQLTVYGGVTDLVFKKIVITIPFAPMS